MSMLKKLLRHPHAAVFDKDPAAAVAFKINRAGGLKWRIEDEVMTVTLPGQTIVYDLARHTIGSLINSMRADTIITTKPAAFFFGRSARVLLDGEGDASVPGGDAVLGFRSLLWSIYAGYASELRHAKSMVSEALKQMIITQAEDEWLDVWGDLYGVPRIDGESDANLQRRIPQEAFRLRTNKYAIQRAIHDLTGLRVFIRETWPQMFRLDESRLSGSHRLVDGDQWRYGYIQPVAYDLFDWTGVLEVIDRNKAAGVVVLGPLVEVSRSVDGELNGTISFGAVASHGAWVKQVAENRLDWMRLGNTRPHRNWGVDIIYEFGITNTVQSGSWAEAGPGWPRKPWSYGTRIDDLNGTTSLGLLSENEPVQLLYGTPEFGVREAASAWQSMIGTNFNRWRGGRTWRQDTWVSRGSPVPSRAGMLMETETQP